jgi:hypothetical protein
MDRLTHAVAVTVLLILGTVASGGRAQAEDTPPILPVIASSEISQGPNRFLFGLADAAGAPVSAPGVNVRLELFDDAADPDVVAFEAGARFLWAIEDVSGLYAADLDFPHPGRWGIRFHADFPDGRSETVRADLDVSETSSTPAIGSPAPSIDTPVADDVGGDLRLISTDPHPDPRFYRVSLSDALAAHAPTVLVFATPAFCQSATCGPTLATIKTVADAHPQGVDFIHVEPYQMAIRDGSLQPLLSGDGRLQVAPWTAAYGLLTEPFVVIVDAAGLVQAKFEGAITADELEAALGAAMGTVPGPPA